MAKDVELELFIQDTADTIIVAPPGNDLPLHFISGGGLDETAVIQCQFERGTLTARMTPVRAKEPGRGQPGRVLCELHSQGIVPGTYSLGKYGTVKLKGPIQTIHYWWEGKAVTDAEEGDGAVRD